MKKHKAVVLFVLSIILAAGAAQAKPPFDTKPSQQDGQQQEQAQSKGGGIPLPDLPTCTVRLGDNRQAITPELQDLSDHSTILHHDQEELRARVVTVANFLNTSARRLGMLETIDSDLIKVENALKSIKQGAGTAQAIPQAREKASALEKRVTPALQKVTAAREKMDAIVAKTKPLREKLQAAGRAADTANTAMLTIDSVLAVMPRACLLAAACDHFPGSLTHIDSFSALATKIDPGIQEYDKVVKLLLEGTALPSIDFFDPFDAQLEAGDALREQLEAILKDLTGLTDQLDRLNRVLNRSFSFSFPYLNPTLTNPTRISNYTVSVSFRTIMEGTKAIEDRIESLLSGYLWGILKNLGLSGYVNDLKNAANNAADEMLRAVGFDVSVDVPDFDALAPFVEAIPNLELAVNKVNFPDIKSGLDITGIDTQLKALFPAGFNHPFKCNPACVFGK